MQVPGLGAPPAGMDAQEALAVLSAMITPAVLILGTSSLIGVTSQRLGRILDRTRSIGDQLEQLLDPQGCEQNPARCELLRDQARKSAIRARLLQQAMTTLCLALGSFVATSAALGLDRALGFGRLRFLALFGLVGVGFLLYASVLLVRESRVAWSSVSREMDYLRDLGQR